VATGYGRVAEKPVATLLHLGPGLANGLMPKAFLAATGSYNSGSLNLTAIPSVGQQDATFNLNGGRFGGSILAGVTLPLYDGGTRSAALAQAHAEADSAAARLTRVRDDAVRQIVLADNALRTGPSAHSASEALLSAAQTTFDAALAAYRSGVGSSRSWSYF
jgi:outer membrane protein